jgi:hypothetical protein
MHNQDLGVKRFAPAPFFSPTRAHALLFPARTLAAVLNSTPSRHARLRSAPSRRARLRSAALASALPRSPSLHYPHLCYAAPRTPMEEPSVEEPPSSMEEPPPSVSARPHGGGGGRPLPRPRLQPRARRLPLFPASVSARLPLFPSSALLDSNRINHFGV